MLLPLHAFSRLSCMQVTAGTVNYEGPITHMFIPFLSCLQVTAGTVNYEGPITLLSPHAYPLSYCMQVTAGTVNYEGPITLRASSTGSDSTLAGIGRLVADAQVRRSCCLRKPIVVKAICLALVCVSHCCSIVCE